LIGAKNVQTYAILANFQMEEMEEQMLDGNFFGKDSNSMSDQLTKVMQY